MGLRRHGIHLQNECLKWMRRRSTQLLTCFVSFRNIKPSELEGVERRMKRYFSSFKFHTQNDIEWCRIMEKNEQKVRLRHKLRIQVFRGLKHKKNLIWFESHKFYVLFRIFFIFTFKVSIYVRMKIIWIIQWGFFWYIFHHPLSNLVYNI